MEQQAKGALREAVGRAKDAAGALTGDLQTQARGKFDVAAGAVQRAYGQARDRSAAFADQARQRGQALYDLGREQAVARPLTSLGAALATGIVLGLVLGACGGRSTTD